MTTPTALAMATTSTAVITAANVSRDNGGITSDGEGRDDDVKYIQRALRQSCPCGCMDKSDQCTEIGGSGGGEVGDRYLAIEAIS